VFLGKNKETLDAKLWAILVALDTTIRETSTANHATLLTIFCDSQKVLTTIRQPPSQRENGFLRAQIYYKAEKLKTNGYTAVCRWVSGHTGLMGNKKLTLQLETRLKKGEDSRRVGAH